MFPLFSSFQEVFILSVILSGSQQPFFLLLFLSPTET